MTDILRPAFRTLLALVLLTGGTGLAGAATFDARTPSVSGSYLAGTQALYDLRTAEAAQRFRDALSADWENPQIVERGFIAFAANGNIEESADTARRLTPDAPQYDLGRLVIATHALKERRYDDVLGDLEGVTPESFAGITAALVRAWALIGAGRPAEAEAVVDELAESGLEDFLVFHRALMAEASGDNVTAIRFAAQAHESDPFVARIVEAYARMLGNAGRFDEASRVVGSFEREGYTHPLVTAVAEAIAAKRRPGPSRRAPRSGPPGCSTASAWRWRATAARMSRSSSCGSASISTRAPTSSPSSSASSTTGPARGGQCALRQRARGLAHEADRRRSRGGEPRRHG